MKIRKFLFNVKYSMLHFPQLSFIYMVDMQGTSSKLHMSVTKTTPSVLFRPPQQYLYSLCPNDRNNFPANKLIDTSHPILAAPVFGISSLLYVAEYYTY